MLLGRDIIKEEETLHWLKACNAQHYICLWGKVLAFEKLALTEEICACTEARTS